MKDDRTLADRLEGAIKASRELTMPQVVLSMTDAFTVLQALRSQPSVEEVARVIALTIDVEDGVVTGFNEAARQINSMYEGKG